MDNNPSTDSRPLVNCKVTNALQSSRDADDIRTRYRPRIIRVAPSPATVRSLTLDKILYSPKDHSAR